MERNHRVWSEMTLSKAGYLSPFTEVAGKGRKAFHRERGCLESKSRLFDFEDICEMGEYGFPGWTGVGNNGGRTSEVRKSTIPLRIIHSISNRNPDKKRLRVAVSFLIQSDRAPLQRKQLWLNRRINSCDSHTFCIHSFVGLKEKQHEASSLIRSSRNQCKVCYDSRPAAPSTSIKSI
jgi:hypothetical protein